MLFPLKYGEFRQALHEQKQVYLVFVSQVNHTEPRIIDFRALRDNIDLWLKFSSVLKIAEENPRRVMVKI